MIHSKAASFFAVANLVLFVILYIHNDATEIPNVIAYVSLMAALGASLPYYFRTDRGLSAAFEFGLAIFLSIVAIAHNFNYLIASDYQGQYTIENAKRSTNHTEYWLVRLHHGKRIKLRISDPPSANGSHIQLKKGVFGVYFGNWK
jgi:hypothetical protein